MVLDHLAPSRNDAGFSVSKNRGQAPGLPEHSLAQLTDVTTKAVAKPEHMTA